MSNNTSSTTSGGISVLGLLGVVFVTLKLLNITEVAAWSWWLVLAPFWVGIAIFLAIVVFIIIGAAIVSIFDK